MWNNNWQRACPLVIRTNALTMFSRCRCAKVFRKVKFRGGSASTLAREAFHFSSRSGKLTLSWHKSFTLKPELGEKWRPSWRLLELYVGFLRFERGKKPSPISDWDASGSCGKWGCIVLFPFWHSIFERSSFLLCPHIRTHTRIGKTHFADGLRLSSFAFYFVASSIFPAELSERKIRRESLRARPLFRLESCEDVRRLSARFIAFLAFVNCHPGRSRGVKTSAKKSDVTHTQLSHRTDVRRIYATHSR